MRLRIAFAELLLQHFFRHFLDRAAFLLSPSGVRVHYLTDGAYERNGLTPDNAEPLASSGKELALREKAWNHVKLAVKKDVATLFLNGKQIGTAFLIEHYRRNPMLHTRWIGSRNLIKFALTGALVRVLTSEQNFGASGLLSATGLVNDQLVAYYAVLSFATLMGAVLSIARLDPTDLRRPILVALAVITVGAFLDTHSGLRTGPVNLYFSQGAIAFAAVYVMGPLLLEGLLRAISRGPAYMVSFLAVFSLSQTIGGLAGVAALSAFHTLRTKAHLMTLGQSLSTTNPELAQGINAIAASLTGSIADPALRSATAAGQVVREAAREATILAFNDVFVVIGSLSAIAFVAMFARWVYDRRRGINPLARELEVLQKLRAQNQ